MLSPQWSVKAEYRYIDLGSHFESASIGLAGLNYHFGAPPPPPPAPMDGTGAAAGRAEGVHRVL
jgi:hypothetical protein